jgi:sulfate adenylyltransferase subunit 1
MSLGDDQKQLRFVTAGSVDDGKSTLIGRLLYDSKAIMADQIEAIGKSRFSRTTGGKTGDDFDLAMVTDGLEAEREQGITIDVAYRYFATPKRSFIIADAPGHEQYTRNLVTAASTADVAIILVDASRTAGKPLKVQTRRHTTIAHMLGLTLVFAVNKMDMVAWSQAVFDELSAKVEQLARSLGGDVHAIVPLSAKSGDYVATASGVAPWYQGPTLLHVLESVDVSTDTTSESFRFPVQRVVRQDTKRFYQGRIESGQVKVGDKVLALPSRQTATIEAIETFDGAAVSAPTGQSVNLVLREEVDLSRGDTLTSLGASTTNQIVADICWLDEQPWQQSTRYLLKQGTKTCQARIEDILFVRDMTALSEITQSSSLTLNDIASVRLRAQSPLVADVFVSGQISGAFVLIDPVTNQTAAAGMIREAA